MCTHPRKPIVRPRCCCPPATVSTVVTPPRPASPRARNLRPTEPATEELLPLPATPIHPRGKRTSASISSPLPSPPSVPSREYHRRAQVPATAELTCSRYKSLRTHGMSTRNIRGQELCTLGGRCFPQPGG